jgi:hypothetical protein
VRIGIPFAIAMAGVCSACGSSDSQDVAQPEASSTLIKAEQSAAPKLTKQEALLVCKIGQAFRVARDPATIDAKAAPDDLIRLSYTRDDGKFFRYDCMIEGEILRYRMIDEAGPGTGPGTWSGRGSTTTFQIKGAKITLQDVFTDGSSDQETYDFVP